MNTRCACSLYTYGARSLPLTAVVPSWGQWHWQWQQYQPVKEAKIQLISQTNGARSQVLTAANAYGMAYSDSRYCPFLSFELEPMESLAAVQRQLTFTGGGTKARRSQRALLTGGECIGWEELEQDCTSAHRTLFY